MVHNYKHERGDTSSGMLRGARIQDADAWRRMTTVYAPLVYSWARHAGLQENDSADIVQEVFRTVAMRIGEFEHSRDGSTFQGWLRRITTHKIGDWIRRARNEPPGVGGSDAHMRLLSVASKDAIDDNDVSLSDVAGVCRRAAELIEHEFEPHTWAAFWLVTVEGVPAAEVAERLSMRLGAVYTAKSRVLRRLRVVLGDQNP